MKFNPKVKIKTGTIRIIKRFAFFPVTEYVETDDISWRKPGATIWLQTFYIRQERVGLYDGPDKWSNLEFVNKEEYSFFINNLTR